MRNTTEPNEDKDLIFPLQIFSTGFVVVVALGILGEPTAQHPLLLHENLSDAPEARKSKTSQDRGDRDILHQERETAKQQATGQPDPPTLLAQMIFHFDDCRMADSDTEKDGSTNNNSTEIHSD